MKSAYLLTRKLFMPIALLLFVMTTATAQTRQGSHYVYHEQTTYTEGQTIAIPLPNLYADQKRKVKSFVLTVKAITGENNNYGNIYYDFKISFDLTNVTPRCTLALSQYKPEAILNQDFTSYASGNGGFNTPTLTISNITTKGSDASQMVDMRPLLKLDIAYDIDYGFDIASLTRASFLIAPTPQPATITAKRATFNWENNGYEFPDYELQLLRLYNTNPAATTEQAITTEVDWSKALKYHTESDATSFTSTISEGQGYYLWRVRPIGSYYDGGIGNDKNYSDQQWSTTVANGSYPIDANSLNAALFYFTDPDDTLNTIYTRTFSEGNKSAEQITYANGLNQAVQKQVYLPSKDTALLTQSVPDYAGRMAVTTMPLPVAGTLQGYRKQQISAPYGQFGADDFDTDTKLINPSKMVGKATQYYAATNTDKQLPDAEGYPYTRTTFYEDGRVKEQSGVGKTYMVGDGLVGNAKGKTINTTYTTPTETELIRLFGDEAPASENVVKTITTDQNNSASVTYTTKEGRTIATSLTTLATDNAGAGQPFDTLGYETAALPLTDTIANSQLSSQGYISSKRVVMLTSGAMTPEYAIQCRIIQEACSDITLKCGFKVRFSIHNIDGSYDTTLVEKSVDALVCNQGFARTTWPLLNLRAGTYVVEKRLLTTGKPNAVVTDAKERIEKQIMPLANMIKTWLQEVKCPKKLTEFYTKLRTLDSNVTVHLARNDTLGLDNIYRTPLKLAATDHFFTPKHNVTLKYNTLGSPFSVRIVSPCCDLTVPVEYLPPFRCENPIVRGDLNGDGSLLPNPDYFMHPEKSEILPDFEGYALSMLTACFTLDEAKSMLQKYMNGWKPGEFNLMCHHMLTDRYNSEGLKYVPLTNTLTATTSNNPKLEVYPIGSIDECGDTIRIGQNIIPDCLGGDCRQYTCDKLSQYWMGVVMGLREQLCPSLEWAPQETKSPSDGFDDNANDGGKKHNDQFDESTKDMNFFVKWLVKRKLSKKMRDNFAGDQGGIAIPTYKKHLVDEFLKGCGMQFAKIISPSDKFPLYGDRDLSFAYAVPSTDIADVELITNRKYKPDHSWAAHYADDFDGTGALKPGSKNIFPNIFDPIYAFKYYEYIENNRQMEVSTCYTDPNDCYTLQNGVRKKVPCCKVGNSTAACAKDYTYPNLAAVKDGSDGKGAYKFIVAEFCDVGRYRCTLTKDFWTSGQRYGFYDALRYQVQPPASFYDTGDQANCLQLVNEAPAVMLNMTNGCKSTCDANREDTKLQLIELLNRRCYIVGGCKKTADDNIITLESLEAMVDSLTKKCKENCPITTYSCKTKACRPWDATATEFGASQYQSKIDYGVGGTPLDRCQTSGNCTATSFSYCQRSKYNMVQKGTVQLEIESRCEELQDPDFAPSNATTIACPPPVPNTSTTGGIPDRNDLESLFTPKASNAMNVSVEVTK